MLHCSCYMTVDRYNCYFSFLAIFCCFTPPPPCHPHPPPPPPPQQHNTKKQNFLKNEKNAWRYHHFTHVPKIMITWCNFQDCLNPICSSGQEIKTTFPSSLSQLLLCKKNIFLKKITSLILIFYSRATYL